MMGERRRLIAGNWKMNGLVGPGLALARGLATRVADAPPQADILICPPATLIHAVATALKATGIAVGGQDCHAQPSGAFTGDLSAGMLADAGATAVILGHSERRGAHGETDAAVQAKAVAAIAAGLTPIICVGESATERAEGRALAVVGAQLLASVPAGVAADRLVIAYEPIWAIGTGKIPTEAQVAETHAHLRQVLLERVADGAAVRILYGGSVKASNAATLLALPNVDGALVGGASLVLDEFWGIVTAG